MGASQAANNLTFRVERFGRVEVEVRAEEGDKIRGHRSSSSWRGGDAEQPGALHKRPSEAPAAADQ